MNHITLKFLIFMVQQGTAHAVVKATSQAYGKWETEGVKSPKPLNKI